MKTKLLSCIFNISVLLVFFLISINSNAQVIASWNYETLAAYPTLAPTPTADFGVGSSSVVNPIPAEIITPSSRTGMNPAGTGCGAQDGILAWALEPFNYGSNQTNGVQYNVSTVGFTGIGITWDMRFSKTAPNTVRLQVSSNGTTYSDFNMTAANTSICGGSITSNGCFQTDTGDVFRRVSVNLSSNPFLNNNANFRVRILAAIDPVSGTFRPATSTSTLGVNGTWRFDNVAFRSVATIPTNVVINPSATVTVCAGVSASLRFVISPAPKVGEQFTLVYRDNTTATNITLNNYVSGTTIPVTPATTTNYTLVSIVNSDGTAGVVSAVSNKTVTVNPLPALPISGSLFNVSSFANCAGTPPGGASGFPPASFTVGATNYTTVYTNTATGLPFTFPIAVGATINFTTTIRNLTTNCIWVSGVNLAQRNTSPNITTQPSTTAQSTCVGGTFSSITVAVTGAGLLYQWTSTTDNLTYTLLTSAAEIANGSQTATYTPLSTAVGTLRYRCNINGSCSPAVVSNNSGDFIVGAAPIAGTVASNQSICAGTTPASLVLSGALGSVTKWQKADNAAFTLGVTDIVSTATTLPAATIGIINQTTFFRAFVLNNNCTVTTAPVQIEVRTKTWDSVSFPGSWDGDTLPPTATESIVFDGNFTSTGNLQGCSCTVTSGAIVIDSGHTMTLLNGLAVAGGSLTFENNASLVQVNNTTNTGNITYKRNTTPVRKFDYTYWSSPVDLQILANLSPLTLVDKYFWFNTTIYNWNAVTAPALTPMDIGKGYIIRAPQNYDPVTPAIYTGPFVGVPNNGNYTVDIVKTGANDLNCIGNPYPSAVSAREFIEDNPGAFTNLGVNGTTLYFWTHNTPITANNYVFSDYAVYNFSGGVGEGFPVPGVNNNTPNGMIAAGQAFMIKGVIEGTTTATFTNSMREVGNNSQFFRLNSNEDIDRNRIWLELKSNEGLYKQILVGYIENATDGFDNGFDGEVLEAGNSAGFYSILNAKNLAIQGRSLNFNADDQIQLGYKTTVASEFEINLSDFDGFFENQDVFIEDRMLNVIHNLKESPYLFSTEIGTFDSRFILRFTSSYLGNSESDLISNSIVIYKNSEQKINVNSSVKKMKSIQVFDVLGRLLWSKENINSNELTLNDFTSNSILLISIELTDNQKISKKYSN